MSAPLLVVAHEASRTGSPKVLLDLLTHAAPRLGAPIAVRLLAEGALGPELRALATADHVGAVPAAVLVNSAYAADEVAAVAPGTPAVAYVHEEDEALAVLPSSCAEALRTRFTRVLCVSERSRADLVAMGVDAERVAVLPPAVHPPTPAEATDVGAVLAEAGVDPGRPLLLGCGEAAWRKGPDLFVDVARRIADEVDAGFAWIGRRPRSFGRVLDNDTRAVGLEGRLRWIGEVEEVWPWFAGSTLVLMTSREDPQPLVPLEAAAAGTATAGFEVGGVAELAACGAASAVPYPDTTALAALAVGLIGDEPARRALAASAAALLVERTTEAVGDRFVGELLSVLGAAR